MRSSSSSAILPGRHGQRSSFRPTDQAKNCLSGSQASAYARTILLIPGRVYCRPFQSLLQMKVRQRNSVPCSLSPEGPSGRAHMKKDLPVTVSAEMEKDNNGAQEHDEY